MDYLVLRCTCSKVIILNELCSGDGERIGPTTETVGDEQDVSVASRRDRKRAKTVNADGDAGTFRQRNGDDRRSDSQSWGFPRHFKQWRSQHRAHTLTPTH